MTLLVTGGAGFIGSNFIFYWLKHHPEDQVVCLDKLTYAGNLATLVLVMDHPSFRFVRGDICDRAAVKRLFEEEQPQAVINFAAESHVDRSIQAPEVFLQTNVLGTQVLLDACCAHGGVRFHQVSTDEVYGDLPLDRPDLLFTEESPLRPSSPYSASKAGADLLALAYCRTYGLPVTVSRCSNNYGPYQFPEKLIPLLINNAKQHKTLPVYGDGMQIRDWLYVMDHCKAIDMVANGGKDGEVYNVGGHNERPNIFIVKTVIAQLHDRLKDEGISEELITHVADRLGHDRRYGIDRTKIKEALGWYPETPFAQGIVLTIDWYLAHPDWMAHVTSGDYQKYYEQMYKNK